MQDGNHDVEVSRLEEKIVEPADIVLTGLGDENAGGYGSPQINLGMHLDSGFGFAEVGPREKSQGEVDGCGIECIDCVVDVQAEVLSCVKRSGFADKALGQILPETPIPLLVGIGQCRFGNGFPKAQMIAGCRTGIEAVGNIPQSFPPCQLGKGHADELLAASKMPNPRLGIVALDQAVESLAVNQTENLRQNKLAGIHGQKSGCFSSPSHHFSCSSASF